MKYYISRKIKSDFDKAVAKVTEELKKEGFGVLTQIDVQETLKNKLNVDFRDYLILGACNPEFAYRALQAEDKIGTMLPCNVILEAKKNGYVEVSAIDPKTSMQAIENETIGMVASEIQHKLTKVLNQL